MCRWFAYISPSEDSLLEDVLVEPAHAISKQVNEHYLPKLLIHSSAAEHTTSVEIASQNRVLSDDGFGVAWYTSTASTFSSPCRFPTPHPTLYKTIAPPLTDLNFRSLAANVASTCILSHVRMATSSAITPVNNHPFVFGRHTIMHNGRITDFATVGRQMEGLMSAAAYKHMLGRTDSESFAALYMTYLCAGNGNNDGGEAWEKDYSLDEMLEALQFAANSVIELQVKALGENARANDLNVCVTDGERLVAMRFRNHERQQPPSLYYSTTAGVTMNRKYPDHPDGAACAHGPARGRKHGVEVKQEGEGANAEAGGGIGPGHNPFAQKRPEEHGRHVIVASEPTTYNAKEWELIEKNHAVLVEDGRVRVQQLTRIEGVGCGK